MAGWLLGLLAVGGTCGIAIRRFSRTTSDAIVHGYLVAFGVIVVSGDIASAAHRLRSPGVWLIGSAAAFAAAAVLARRFPGGARAAAPRAVGRGEHRDVLAPMVAAIAATGAANLVVLLGTAPNGIDGLDYHLARLGYYLQQNSFAYYDADFWAQVVHPLNSTILSAHAYLTGGGSERLASVWQYLSYWAAIAAVFGITERLTGDGRRALFSALLFGLLTQALMQSNAAGNDMILAALAAAALFELLAYDADPRPHHLGFAAVAIGLGLGTKASFAIAAVPLLGAALFVTVRAPRPRQTAGWLAAFLVGAAAVFVVPAGYVTTVQRFGSPIGPADARARHSFADRGVRYAAIEGGKNVLRLGADFLSLDGLPRIDAVNRAQRALREPVRAATTAVGIDLERPNDIRAPFAYDRIASANEVHSYWGVLGIALVWASVFGVLIRRPDGTPLLLAAMTLAFLVLEAFSGPYDPWRGRFFLIAAAFATPLASRWLGARGIGRVYLVAVVWLGCVSALTAVAFRSNRPLLSASYQGHVRPSVFALDRIGQMTTNVPSYEEPLRRYERLVPSDATVAVALIAESPEYLFFGPRLGRTLRPINSFEHGLQPVPSDAAFLLLSRQVLAPRPDDEDLGAGLYLRRTARP